MTTNILQHPEFDQIAGQYEEREGLPRGTLRSLVFQESRGNPNTVSPAGARGVAQFMAPTAKAYNVDVADPWDSLRGAAEYLGDSFKKYGTLQAALAEYNGGPRQANAVVAGKAPSAKETRNYIEQVSSRIPKQQAVQQSLKEGATKGEDTTSLIARLYENGYAEEISFARERGYSDREILGKIGDQAFATQTAANDKREAVGVLGTAADTVADKVKSGARGARIVAAKVGGSTADVAALQAEEAADRANPDKIALRGSTTGKVVGTATELAPTVGAALLTGGASLPAQAAILGTTGAVQGALRPTVEGESNVQNALTEGVLNAAAPVGARVVGKAINAGGRAVDGALPKLSSQGEQVAGRLEALGITPNRAIIAQNEGKSVVGHLLTQEDDAARAATQSQLQSALRKLAGVSDDTSLRAATTEATTIRNQLYQDAVKTPLEIGGARASFKGASIAAEVQGAIRQAVDNLGTSIGRSRAQQATVFSEVEKIIAPLGKDKFATLEPINNAVKDLKKLSRSSVLSQPEQSAARTVADRLEQSMFKRMTADQQAKYGQAVRQTQAVKILDDLAAKAETKGVVSADDITRAARRAVKGNVEDNAFYKLAQDFKKVESVQSTGKWTEKMGKAIADSLGSRAVSTAAGAVLGGPVGAVVGATGIGQGVGRTALNALARSKVAKALMQRRGVPQFKPGAKTNAALIAALNSRSNRPQQ